MKYFYSDYVIILEQGVIINGPKSKTWRYR